MPGEPSPDRMDALVWAMSRLYFPQRGDVAQLISDDEGMVRISRV